MTYQAQLRHASLPIIPNGICEELLRGTRLGPRFRLHPSFVCAGGDGPDTCQGDGGGPLICPLVADASRFAQVGGQPFMVTLVSITSTLTFDKSYVC